MPISNGRKLTSFFAAKCFLYATLHFSHDCRCRSNVNNCYDFDELLTTKVYCFHFILWSRWFHVKNRNDQQTAWKLLRFATVAWRALARLLNINRMCISFSSIIYNFTFNNNEKRNNSPRGVRRRTHQKHNE